MKPFKRVYIEITNRCNLSCSFCTKTTRPLTEMSLYQFAQILYHIKPYTDYLFLHVMGEPLFHSNIGDILDICHAHGMFVYLTTNGTLLSAKGDELLTKPALRRINISLHSFEKDMAYWHAYKDVVFRFIAAARLQNKISPMPISISLKLWNVQTDAYHDLWMSAIQNEFSLPFSLNKGVTDRNGVKLYEHIYLQQEEIFDWPSLHGEIRFTKGSCFGLKNHIAILVNGDVIPCCLDANGILTLGNIFEQDMSDILQSPLASELREGFQQQKVVHSFFQTCGFRH